MVAEVQHYVPKFLLKQFTRGKKPKIWVYDKTNDNCFQTNIKNVAAETSFYDIELKDSRLTFEPGLANLEAKSSIYIKKIIQTGSLKVLDELGTATLAAFLAIQFVRTKEHRIRWNHLNEELRKSVVKRGFSEEAIEEFFKNESDLPKDKVFGFISIQGAKDFVPSFLDKSWVLLKTPKTCPLYISDNPITLHNDREFGLYGNIGLSVPGIQIYLPIASNLCLALFCRSHYESVQKTVADIEAMEQLAPGLSEKNASVEFARRLYSGMVNGNSVPVVVDNVTMMNSLQVGYSTRFVYCESNDFGLVRKMIDSDPSVRNAPRPTLT